MVNYPGNKKWGLFSYSPPSHPKFSSRLVPRPIGVNEYGSNIKEIARDGPGYHRLGSDSFSDNRESFVNKNKKQMNEEYEAST